MEIRETHAVQTLISALLAVNLPTTARLLAEALPRLPDLGLRRSILAALQTITDPRARDEVWAAWEASRFPELADLLCRKGWLAVYPPRLAVLSLLLTAQVEKLKDAPSGLVPPLLEAAADPDPQIARRAAQALAGLADRAAQEEVCRWVIERDHPAARLAALQAGYAPHDPQRRALFYLLTEQWQRYEQLDFDASLLRAVYQAGETALRSKIAGLARQSGWAGYVEAVAGGGTPHRLEELSASEWEVVLTLLGRGGRWSEVWRLAQAAPPTWSAQLLGRLVEAAWQPPGPEADAGFAELCQAAAACRQTGAAPRTLARYQACLKGHTRPVTCFAFTPDGRTLVSGSVDQSLRTWETASGLPQQVLLGHSGHIECLAVSPGGQVIASGSADKTVRLWQLPGGTSTAILGGHAREASSLAFAPDSLALASGDAVGVRLWKLDDNHLLQILSSPAEETTSLDFTADGKVLVRSAAGHTLELWQAPYNDPPNNLMEKVSAWAFYPTRSQIITAKPYGYVRTWQLPFGTLVNTLDGRVDGRSVALASQSGLLAASDGNAIRRWQLPAGKSLPTLEGHASQVTRLAFAPNGWLLASSGEDRLVCLWETENGHRLYAFEQAASPPRQLVFSPSGEQLACCEGNVLHLWALVDVQPIFQKPAAHLTPDQLKEAANLFDSYQAGPVARAWLAFAQTLLRWQLRYEIEICEAPPHINLGEFDIEIA